MKNLAKTTNKVKNRRAGAFRHFLSGLIFLQSCLHVSKESVCAPPDVNQRDINLYMHNSSTLLSIKKIKLVIYKKTGNRKLEC